MPSDSLVHASSGALGGICAMAITYPLISISTRAQVEARRHPGESSLEAALHLIKREGFRSLYDGLGSSLIGIALTNGIYYLFFEESRAVLLLRSTNSTKRSLSTIESMLAGAIAGTMTAVLTNPIWVVNTRQTVRVVRSNPGLPSTARSKRMGFLQTVLHILKTDGAMALFRGLGPALILVINPILQYTLFEQMKNILIARRKRLSQIVGSGGTVKEHVLRDADYFILGAISKLFATGSTYPYLTVKSRMQSGQAEGKEYRSTFDGLQKIVAKDGIKGLYRGIAPKLTQSVLTAAFLFLAKERIYVATKKALKTASKITPV
ncbi:hypothetical protein MJO28_005861 [Puccinia striiformis f. sp. tritici]|uniref:Mitochondrial carrier n=2 Tax=Puccinia striiformis f. sp. tritici TaxID=168172 RepID=A0A0L0V587_9BASI|nr:hypothetical protein Pst134EA_011076 [Puccinia striiformis f. sp. tritici]KNE94361.1 hypothetical protein PSTG_12263 [Puccinia striiformis f. sp. tritici PST-78]KAH9455824.1 hypothetical protein Pst134EB_012060 [Puccinia striiformis f. sp. tritici]KAH9467429.1 hypothetical protein Pst134EA_011076 [Puccinia striiformis f. sp. tritici]KAI7953314.1 hypothetical protein MJO28_005861 [Puccinia striiformis f. sp. tritici]KAI7957608.1 hypothetical protein MJO29_005825 [Puccinia striiformis f. sp. 